VVASLHASCPIGPPPVTNTVRPASSPASSTARSAVAVGSTQAASNVPISSGIRRRWPGKAAISGASAPSACRPSAVSKWLADRSSVAPIAVRARAVYVAVRVDRDPLIDRPVFNLVTDCCDPAGGLVAEDAITPVHLRQLGCVQIAAANTAHVDFDQDLIGPQRRARPVL